MSKLCVITNSGSSGEACNASTLGFVDPCQTLAFKVKGDIPPGYIAVAKYEWFVNGVSVKVTTNPSDPILLFSITSYPISVYCKVTYQNRNGDITTPFSSTTFAPLVKILDFYDITTTNPPPNYGCSTNTVSYSLVETPCNGSGFPCKGYYNVLGNYNITWQAPSGWVQTSLTNKGSDVSFIPDATSGGILIATIHLSCGYTETRSLSISRAPQSPVFTTSTVQSCNSTSASMSISPVCGALNYTYVIEGVSGVKFAANGQQTLTTSQTSVNFTLEGGNSVNIIKARVNYSNNIVSEETKGTLIVGLKTPVFDIYYPGGSCPGNFYEAIGASNNGSDVTYNWYINGVLDAYHGYKIRRTFQTNYTEIKLSVSKSGCGTSDEIRKVWNCSLTFSIFPNPATSELVIESNTTNISRIRILDKFGNIKKEIPNSIRIKKLRISITDLPADVYTLQIFDGSQWQSNLFLKK